MKKKFMMMLLSAMMATGSMSIVHAAEPDEDFTDEIIEAVDVSDEKLTIDDSEEIAPRMDSLRKLFDMDYVAGPGELFNSNTSTPKTHAIYGDYVDTKALRVTVTPNASKSADCSLRAGICYQDLGTGKYERVSYRSFNSLKGGAADLYLPATNPDLVYYGFVTNTGSKGTIYGNVQFDEYVNW